MIKRLSNNHIIKAVRNRRFKHLLLNFEDVKNGINTLHEKEFSWPYTLAYWYFNSIDLETGKVYSYILARTNNGLEVDGKSYDTSNGKFLTGLIDVKNKKFVQKLLPANITSKFIKTDNFIFTFSNKNVAAAFGDDKYIYDQILSDTCHVKYPAYEYYNLRACGGKAYMCAQYVVAKGPLIPWNWLHFYLEDGTYIKVFQIARVFNNKLKVGKHVLNLDGIDHSKSEILYIASDGDKYFRLTLKLDYLGKISYKPRFSPTWHYPQVGVHAKKIETNLEDISTNQKGYGIMEIAKGWAF